MKHTVGHKGFHAGLYFTCGIPIFFLCVRVASSIVCLCSHLFKLFCLAAEF